MAVSRGRSALLAGAMVLALAAAAGIVTVVTGSHGPGAAFTGGAVNPSTAPVPPPHGAYFGARVRPSVTHSPPKSPRSTACRGRSGGGSTSCTSTPSGTSPSR